MIMLPALDRVGGVGIGVGFVVIVVLQCPAAGGMMPGCELSGAW